MVKKLPHLSVLASEILDFFRDRSCHYFLDGTLGAGGHAELLLKAHPELQLYIGIDQDPIALQIAGDRLTPWKEKLALRRGNFGEMQEHLKLLGVDQLDGILLDLGVSSMQLDQAEKGFSFMREGPLDMRMDPEGPLSARDVVNTFSEKDLGFIFRKYAEEKQWRSIARAIVEARQYMVIETTTQLVEILMPVLGWKKSHGIHPLTLAFQGLRIFVNKELEVLEKGLCKAISLLRKGGRLAVISFHSLEDRIVKDLFRFAASDKEDTRSFGTGLFLSKEPEGIILTRKPIIASPEEMESNPRSRSAKLRVFQKG